MYKKPNTITFSIDQPNVQNQYLFIFTQEHCSPFAILPDFPVDDGVFQFCNGDPTDPQIGELATFKCFETGDTQHTVEILAIQAGNTIDCGQLNPFTANVAIEPTLPKPCTVTSSIPSQGEEAGQDGCILVD